MGGFANDEIPLLVMLFYLFRDVETSHASVWFWIEAVSCSDLRGRHRQVGSLAGAAHLLNDNTGVLRSAQWEQKSHVEQKGKSWLNFDFQFEYKLWKHGLSIL